VPKETLPDTPRVIRRYENRKLYDVDGKRYVTLDDLARLIAAGTEVEVLDQRTGEDLTNVTLAQVLLETVRQKTAHIPHPVLARLIRLGWGRATAWSGWASPRDAAVRAREEVERAVGSLMSRGRLTLEEALSLRRDVARAVHRVVADAEAAFESRYQAIFAPTAGEGKADRRLRALRGRLTRLELDLKTPRARSKRGGKTQHPA